VPAVPQAGQRVVLGNTERARIGRCLFRSARRGAVGPGGTGTPLERRAEDLDPAHEVPVVEKQGASSFARGLAESRGQRRFSQELDDRIAECSYVSRVLDQQSTVQMLDLREMTPDRTRDDGPSTSPRSLRGRTPPAGFS
jgi:hypothetical protein